MMLEDEVSQDKREERIGATIAILIILAVAGIAACQSFDCFRLSLFSSTARAAMKWSIRR
jgi:hypothetical protein